MLHVNNRVIRVWTDVHKITAMDWKHLFNGHVALAGIIVTTIQLLYH